MGERGGILGLFGRRQRPSRAELEGQVENLTETVDELKEAMILGAQYAGQDADEHLWRSTSGGAGDKEFAEADLESMRKRAWYMYLFNSLAKRQVRHTTSFLLGRGVEVEAVDDKAQPVIDEFREDNDFDMFLREAVNGYQLTGEAIWLLFKNVVNGDVRVRDCDPGEIFEVVRDPEDNAIVKYLARRYIKQNFDPVERVYLAAEEVEETVEQGYYVGRHTIRDFMYLKSPSVVSRKRGISELLSHLRELKWYDQLIRARTIRNKMLAHIVFDVELDTTNKETITRRKREIDRRGVPPPGSVIVRGAKEKWSLLAASQGQAGEGAAGVDMRYLRLMAVAGSGLPEFMLTGDASNANYASTLSALDGFVRYIIEYQDIWEWHLIKLFKYVIDAKKEAGTLGKTVGNGTLITFPEVLTEDIKALYEALTLAQMGGWASDSTVAARAGFDPAAEKEKIEAEKKEADEEAGGHGPVPPPEPDEGEPPAPVPPPVEEA
jgi:hypothetical protein